MKKTTNSGCRKFVQNQEPFRANNLSGDYENGNYVVKSYGWYLVFVCKDGIWYEVDDHYSRTTARHISQARPASNMVKLNVNDMRMLQFEK